MVDYEKDILDVSMDMDVDIKLNPDFYIHTAILSAQKSLLISSLEGKAMDGINSYTIFVRQIQMIAEAANYLSSETVDEINSIETPKDPIGRANHASHRLGVILSNIFGQRSQTGKLVFNPKIVSNPGDSDYDSGKRSAVVGSEDEE